MRKIKISDGTISRYNTKSDGTGKLKHRWRCRVNGKRHSGSGYNSYTQAKRGLEDFKYQIKTYGLEAIDAVEKLFPESYNEYLKEKKQVNKPSWWRNKKGYARVFNRHFGRMHVHVIQEKDVQKYKNKRIKDPKLVPAKGRGQYQHRESNETVSEATVDNELSTLKNFFNWCVDKKYCDFNPAKKVKKFNPDNRRENVIEEVDYQKLIDTARKNPNMKEVFAKLLMSVYAFRHSEMIGLLRKDIDEKNGKFKIKRTKKRKVIITEHKFYSDELMELLLSLPENPKRKGYVFPHAATKNTFKNALKEAGLDPNTCFHDLRHSAATHLYNSGEATLLEIKEMLQHESIETTLRYLHLDRKKSEKLPLKLANKIAGVPKSIEEPVGDLTKTPAIKVVEFPSKKTSERSVGIVASKSYAKQLRKHWKKMTVVANEWGYELVLEVTDEERDCRISFDSNLNEMLKIELEEIVNEALKVREEKEISS